MAQAVPEVGFSEEQECAGAWTCRLPLDPVRAEDFVFSSRKDGRTGGIGIPIALSPGFGSRKAGSFFCSWLSGEASVSLTAKAMSRSTRPRAMPWANSPLLVFEGNRRGHGSCGIADIAAKASWPPPLPVTTLPKAVAQTMPIS